MTCILHQNVYYCYNCSEFCSFKEIFVGIVRGDPIPSTLLEKIDQYLPDDYTKLLYFYEVGP